jgi:hypothetical protein
MGKLIIPGGLDLVEFSSEEGAFFLNGANPDSGVITEIDQLLKAGTSLTPESPTEEFANGKSYSAGKGKKMSIRSANVDDAAGSAYALLKAAEEARTALYFRFRNSNRDLVIDDCEDAWNEQVVANVTSAIDAGDKKVGAASIKLTVGDPVAAGTILASESVNADLSIYSGATMWLKSSVATQKGDLQLVFGASQPCGDILAEIDVPALSAGQWTKCSFFFGMGLWLTDPTMSVGLKMVVDLGAFILWGDDLRAIGNHIVVRNLVPTAEFEQNELGKHNVLKVLSQGYAATEGDLETVNQFEP